MARKVRVNPGRGSTILSRERVEENPFRRRIRNLQIMTFGASFVVVIVLFLIILYRVNMFSQDKAPLSDVVNGERNKISGSIFDRNDKLIAKGKNVNGIINVKSDSLSNLLGVPVGHSKSYFYLRTALGEDLYSVGNPLKSLLGSSLLSTTSKGNDVKLTIDSELNDYIYQEIKESTSEIAVALVYDYETGEVVSNVSYPDYNISGSKYKDLLGKNKLISKEKKGAAGVNRCVSEVYLPASAIKPILYASIFTLDKNLMSKNYYCNGSYPNGDKKPITDKGHKEIGLYRAIAISCNIYPQKLGEEISDEKLEAFIEKKLQLNNGKLSTQEGLYYYSGVLDISDKYEKAMTMIGEGNARISPLMLARLYGAILNKGKVVTPHYTFTGNVESSSIFDADVCSEVLEGMRWAVTKDYGTCKLLADVNCGDATIYAKSGTGDDKNRTSWCISGVKNADKKYVVLTGVFSAKSGNATSNAKTLNKTILNKIYGKN